MDVPEDPGRSPCSASANRLRDPDSAWPMLLPVIETAAPVVMMSAPLAPRYSTAASASGVFDDASPGKVPTALICTERHHDGAE